MTLAASCGLPRTNAVLWINNMTWFSQDSDSAETCVYANDASVDFVAIQGTASPLNVTELNLNDSHLQMFPVLTTSALQKISLINNPIKSLEDVAIPSSLKILELTGTAITDVNTSLPDNLEKLWLDNTNLTSLSIQVTTSTTYTSGSALKEIFLDLNLNIDFQAAKFPEGFSLDCWRCQLTSLDGFALPNRVQFLGINSNHFEAFPSFASKQIVESIDLSDNRITSLAQVSFPNGLKSLKLNSNHIPEIRGVDFPSTLQELSLDNASVKYFDLRKSTADQWTTNNLSLTLDLRLDNCPDGGQLQVIQNATICVWTDEEWQKRYSSPQTSKKSSSTGIVLGVVAGTALVAVCVVITFLWMRKKRSKEAKITTEFSLMMEEDGNDTAVGALLKDPMIFAAKIPLEMLEEEYLVGKGGHGEVYKGTYGNQVVAIKRLLENQRNNLHHIEELLLEAKMMVPMDHPNIVRFVGIAWNALTDLRIVVEFMPGGDLTALLGQYKKSGREPGLDGEKLRIAQEIANGLTYLHSLSPKVIHRDLKSANVLLSETLEAKLTDFGISRQQSTTKMTAGIGTCLWMAPEVMTGSQYDERADIFSFGVVLSEMDTHEMPYHAYAVDASGRRVSEAALLQQVSMGTVRASFTKSTAPEVLELAHRCLSLTPDYRPSAGELTYELHSILRKMVGRVKPKTI